MKRFYIFKKKWKRAFAHFFDLMGETLFFFIRKNQPLSSKKLTKILFTRIDHLGDALLLRPALLRFREAFPDCQVHLLTTPENALIFSFDPFLDRVITYPGHWFQKSVSFFEQINSFFKIASRLRREKYVLAVDFRGDVRMTALLFLCGIPARLGYGITGGGWMLTHERVWSCEKHQVQLNAEMLKDWIAFDIELKNPPVRYPASMQKRLDEMAPGRSKPYAVVHCGAGNSDKEWPRDHLRGIIGHMRSVKYIGTVFLLGSFEERQRFAFPEQSRLMDLRGMTDLHEAACLLSGARFFLGHDSGPAHLAAAQGIPTLVLASSTNQIQYWHPWTKRLKIFLPERDGGFAPLPDIIQAFDEYLKQEQAR